jgi:hypothetical protein
MAFDEKFEVGSQQMQIPKLPSIFTLFYLFCIHLGKSEKATKALGRATSHHIHHLSLSLLFFSPLLSVYHNSSILSFRSIKKITYNLSFVLRSDMERIIGGKYKLGRKIGSGSFGEIYLGKLLLVLLFCMHIKLILFFMIIFLLFLLRVCVVAATHIDTFEIVAIKIVCFLNF